METDQIARDLDLEASTVPYPNAGPSRAALSGEGTWWKTDDVTSTVAGADAVLILTEWQQYRQLDWQALAPLLRQPAWIFDARSVVDPAAVAAAGLQLWRVGDGGDPITR